MDFAQPQCSTIFSETERIIKHVSYLYGSLGVGGVQFQQLRCWGDRRTHPHSTQADAYGENGARVGDLIWKNSAFVATVIFQLNRFLVGFFTQRLPMDLGPSNNLVLKPPTTNSGVSTGRVGSSIESRSQKPLGTRKAILKATFHWKHEASGQTGRFRPGTTQLQHGDENGLAMTEPICAKCGGRPHMYLRFPFKPTQKVAFLGFKPQSALPWVPFKPPRTGYLQKHLTLFRPWKSDQCSNPCWHITQHLVQASTNLVFPTK